ncbi:RNA polymerase I enhancer binding protein [Thecaphora frezii]
MADLLAVSSKEPAQSTERKAESTAEPKKKKRKAVPQPTGSHDEITADEEAMLFGDAAAAAEGNGRQRDGTGADAEAGSPSSEAESEATGQEKPKRKKTGGRVAKPKQPTAKELYKNKTWKPPREARVKTSAELERLNAQRRALAAWAKRHTKRHILVERCFSRMQLGWLTDDIGLQFKRGTFTKEEHQTLKKTIELYKRRNNMSHDVLLDMVFNAKKIKMQREHQLFFQECAGALVDRANTSVRTHVKTFLHPFWRKGYWTFAELQELKTAFEEVGHDFVTIGKRVGRLSNNARSKWFYLEDVRYRANLGPWTLEEKQKLREAVVHFRKEKPRTHLDWKEIAKEVGGNRHPRNYAAMWHCMRAKRLATRKQDIRQRELERSGLTYDEALEQVQREWKEHGDIRDFVSDTIEDEELEQSYPLQEEWVANGFKGEPGMEVDGWEPRVDDLILLQRLRYQRAARKEQVNWDGLGFGQWNWPGDILKKKLEEIVEKRCPAYFRNKRSWPAILDKVYWDIEKEDFDPGYDPHYEEELAAEQAAKASQGGGASEGGGDDGDDEMVDDLPSDLEDYMD